MKNTEGTLLTNPLITTQHLTRKALIYVRQSSVDQVERNTGSQAFQRNQADLARAYGWPEELIEVIDEDLGRSGSTVDRRTGWQKMFDQIAAHKVGCVFAVNISRLGRELLPIEQLRTMALYHGTLLCLDNRFSDPSNPNDTVLTQITATFAQYENRKRVEHMTQARLAKARQGGVVSQLPIGWIKNPDDSWDYDPAVKDTISTIIDVFKQVRTLRGTAQELIRAGVKLPSRHGPKKPTPHLLRQILGNPAYAGTYVYGKTESQRGGPVLANGYSVRVKVPEHLWVKRPNNHPPYLTEEFQQEIKVILLNNNFRHRHRSGRGRALTQGLLRCAVCKRALSVSYQKYSYAYCCGWKITPCTRFTNKDFDERILAEFFKVLEAPPLEMLKTALAETRSHEQSRLNWIESERERLAYEERRAQERAERTHDSLPRVSQDALQKLNKVLTEKDEFEQKIALEQSVLKNDESEEELEELCKLASDVPALWHNPLVTHKERKEILRTLIDYIVVAATKERIDATIFWKSGSQTPFSIWHGVGWYNLIRELHSQKLTAFEIRDHLAAGKTTTGQAVKISLSRLYLIMHKIGLKQNRFPAPYLLLAQKVDELYREGRTLVWIAQHFNEQGFKSKSGNPWSRSMVFHLYHATGHKIDLLQNLHRKVIEEARLRGLNYQEMALEFNERHIRRGGGRPWTASSIASKCYRLNSLQRKRTQKGSTSAELSEPVVLRRSA
jgi:DNA invertase Pin-like site-specific DNA recombinase